MHRTAITITLTLLLAISTVAKAQDNETAGWKALSASVPAHHYPSRGRFTRSPEGNITKRIAALQSAVKTAQGTSAEAVALFYLGNTHFKLNRPDKALVVFKDLQARFPKHGLCTMTTSDEKTLSLVAAAIADCTSEIEIRKVYTPRDLPVATLSNTAQAVFHTSKGDFTMAFYAAAAPKAVANFKKLVKNGSFNNTYFHFVHAMQSIEGGCPNTHQDNRNRNDDGDGSPGYDLPVELNTAIHNAGAVSMKRLRASKRSHGSQFTICATPQPKLNNNQAVFAQVTDGLDIVKRISQERADDHNRPYDHVWIRGVEWIESKNPRGPEAIDGDGE